MQMLLLLYPLLIVLIHHRVRGNCTPNECISANDVVYVNGFISFAQTFNNCLNNIPDPLFLPNVCNGTVTAPIQVNASIQVNNLHKIDAIEGSITLDFYLRLTWQDDRLAMPEFWNRVSPVLRSGGYELTSLINNGDIQMWLPDVRFHDASDLNYLVQTIRMNSSNVVFWSRHTVITLRQADLNFVLYPFDNQTIYIRFGSYAYSQKYFTIGFWGNAFSFNTNFDGSYTFLTNPEWQYQSVSYSLYTSSSGFVNAIFAINENRKGSAVATRLVTPILLLLIVGGLVFWAPPDSRVDSTIVIYLSVSALYVVILNSIPLVGYLTRIDVFVYEMFIMLTFGAILHQLYNTISKKVDKWPLRELYLRLIEALGRSIYIPIVIYLFLVNINQSLGSILPVIYAIFACVLLRETVGVGKCIITTTNKLKIKMEDSEIPTNQFSYVEVFYMRCWNALFETSQVNKSFDGESQKYSVPSSASSYSPARHAQLMEADENDMWKISNIYDIVIEGRRKQLKNILKRKSMGSYEGMELSSLLILERKIYICKECALKGRDPRTCVFSTLMMMQAHKKSPGLCVEGINNGESKDVEVPNLSSLLEAAFMYILPSEVHFKVSELSKTVATVHFKRPQGLSNFDVRKYFLQQEDGGGATTARNV